MRKYKVLLVDDEPNMLNILSCVLSDEGYSVDVANDGKDAISKISSYDYHVAILDLKLPDMTGLDVLREIKARTPQTVAIMITAYSSVDTAIQAMKIGAYDYITKPFKIEQLKDIILKALESGVLFYRTPRVKDSGKQGFEIIGSTAGMQEIFEMIDYVAPTNSSVLIYGETGTGKELLARAIHDSSHRAEKPFVKVNCAAIPEGLLESELFGHERGAFTSAIATRIGLFEAADSGTILLDEIAEMSPAMQAKLLRVTQEKEFERVGSSKTRMVDVRIISATNKNLVELVAQGSFREDLYYRLSVVPFYIPPLRDRKDDIRLLSKKFLRDYSEILGKRVELISDEAMKKLMEYDWPGNVRELENCIERAVIFTKGSVVEADSLFIGLPAINAPLPDWSEQINDTPYEPKSIREMEKAHIIKVLESTDSNRTQAAKILEISRRTLQNKIKKYGIMD
ncbi:MAG: sigma-54-dependent Fis family transcriptional regulator [Firmicutes bacterium]|nr:sigma-54-dependent Fis family transcriptional regulator [Bacillota bacterium]